MEVRSRDVSGASVSPGYARQKCLVEYDIRASTCLFVINMDVTMIIFVIQRLMQLEGKGHG